VALHIIHDLNLLFGVREHISEIIEGEQEAFLKKEKKYRIKTS